MRTWIDRDIDATVKRTAGSCPLSCKASSRSPCKRRYQPAPRSRSRLLLAAAYAGVQQNQTEVSMWQSCHEKAQVVIVADDLDKDFCVGLQLPQPCSMPLEPALQ